MQDQLIMHIGKEGIGNWKAMQKGILEHTVYCLYKYK